jgi:mannose-1-phosphate guanylyltransferase
MVLKALILVGGYGTRLRPLTFSKPKPLVEFVNKPIVLHQIEALVQVGVREIILAVSYKPKQLEDELHHIENKLNIKIHFKLEKIPMGTAGPIKLNEELLDINDPDPFFMLNADVIAEYHFDQLLKFHQSHKCEGTIYVTPVDDPSRYGVVVSDHKGRVNAFVEKPKDKKFGCDINAGLYIFNKSIIKRVPMKPTSIERVIFPAMVQDSQLYTLSLHSFWMDVGKPDDFLSGQHRYLTAIAAKKDERIQKQSNSITGAVVIHDTAQVSKSALIGPNVVIGPNVQIGHNVRIKNSVIFGGCMIADGAYVDGSIVGWNCRVGRWSRLQRLCILGEDVDVKSECCLVGATVCPHKSVSDDILAPQIIL